MAKFCTNCGRELNENATMCLNCGVMVGNNVNNNYNNNNNNNNNYNNKNQNTTNSNKKKKKKGLPTWAIVLIVVGSIVLVPIIMLGIIILISYNTFKNVIDETSTNYNNNEVIYEKRTEQGTIGSTLTINDYEITLDDALIYSQISGDSYYEDIPDEGKEYLVFFLEVENISDEEQYISDYDFEGYADGKEISIEYLFNDINDIDDLDADLLPGEKTKGYVAFEVDTSWKEFELHYSDWFSDDEIIFKVVNEDSSI